MYECQVTTTSTKVPARNAHRQGDVLREELGPGLQIAFREVSRQSPSGWANRSTGTSPAHAEADRRKGAKLSREQIAAAALAIADAQGFEAVSMRKIAAVLGAGTMSLYHYVRTKDDLVALMDDAIMGEVLIPESKMPPHWRDAFNLLAHRTRDVFARHSWAMTALMQARPGPNGMRHVEQSLAALKNTDLSPRRNSPF